MRTIGCRDIQREIEEAGQADSLSLVAKDHLENCAACETFYTKQFKLQQILASLGTIEAPGDFDFRLRARLAGEKRGTRLPSTTGTFSFGFRAAAFAAVPLLIGSALLVVGLRPTANSPVIDNVAKQAKSDAGQPQSNAPNSVAQASDGKSPVASIDDGSQADQPNAGDAVPNPGKRPGTRKSVEPRSADVLVAGNSRVATKDQGSIPAKVFTAEDLVADAGHSVFPIEAASQSVKVSLDNGRGSSKTISLPGVSFGSQRILTQNAPPLLASARGAW